MPVLQHRGRPGARWPRRSTRPRQTASLLRMRRRRWWRAGGVDRDACAVPFNSWLCSAGTVASETMVSRLGTRHRVLARGARGGRKRGRCWPSRAQNKHGTRSGVRDADLLFIARTQTPRQGSPLARPGVSLCSVGGYGRPARQDREDGGQGSGGRCAQRRAALAALAWAASAFLTASQALCVFLQQEKQKLERV